MKFQFQSIIGFRSYNMNKISSIYPYNIYNIQLNKELTNNTNKSKPGFYQFIKHIQAQLYILTKD